MRNNKNINVFLILLSLLTQIMLNSCRSDVEMILSEDIAIGNPEIIKGYKGFYLLNEGNMGSNKATLDFYDFATGIYTRNIYAERNCTCLKRWAMWEMILASTTIRYGRL